MKGIILSGGSGTRLYPLNLVSNKQLLPVYDKPMVYYPLTTLIENGITEIAIINNAGDRGTYQDLLGYGDRYGCNITYYTQHFPRGIAEAFIICESFIGKDDVALILGDNVFSPGCRFITTREVKNVSKWHGARIFGYHVEDPSQYGVVTFNEDKVVTSIVEKPSQPDSNYAVPGFYIYNNDVIEIAKNLKPSARNELEITDVNLEYLKRGDLQVKLMPRGAVWLDAGTCASLHDSSAYVHTIEQRQGIKIGCPEEMAFRKKYIDKAQLEGIIDNMPKGEYKAYLEKLL